MKKLCSILLICCLLASFFVMPVSAAKVTKIQITIEEPVVGGSKSFKATVPATASTEVTSVSWTASPSGKTGFQQGEDYTVTIKLKIKDSSSNVFGDASAINATVNGKAAKVSGRSNKQVTVKYTWECLGGPAPDTPESLLKNKLASLAAAYVPSNGTEEDDVVNYVSSKLPGAIVWAAGGAYRLTKTPATETKDGKLSTNIGITYDGVTIESYSFNATIPALNKSSETINLAADKALMQAAFNAFIAKSTTTADELLAAVNAAAVSGTKATWDSNFRYSAPSATVQGSVGGDIILTLGSSKEILPNCRKILPIAGDNADALIDDDVRLVSQAVHAIVANNQTAQQNVEQIAKAAIKNGSTLTVTSFELTPATFEAAGKFVIRFTLSLQGKTREQRYSVDFSKLVRDFPKDKISINLDEWIVLERTNTERYKQGKPLLTINGDMQEICNIREKEVAQEYSHTRPDGRSCFTAFEEHSKAFGALTNANRGENIAENKIGQWDGYIVSNAWINSPGHYKNMIEQGWVYIGIGFTNRAGVQMFCGYGSEIETIESSTGSFSFASEDEMKCAYLICTMKDGAVSYLPLCPDSMRKDGNRFYASIAKFNKGEFVLTIDPSRANQVGNFTDVKPTDYFGEPVKWAVNSNITTGTATDKFSPNNTCTRAQILTFLWRAVGSPKQTGANPFTDVKTSDYFYDAALWAAGKGMVAGKSFAPNTPCTRADTVVYLWKNADSPAQEAFSSFTDVAFDASYAQAVSWAVKNNITSGTSATTFSPASTCTRGQIVTFLHRALK